MSCGFFVVPLLLEERRSMTARHVSAVTQRTFYRFEALAQTRVVT
jgi:hypothetical protein